MKNVLLLCLLCVLLPCVHGAIHNITCASCALVDTNCSGKTCKAERCVVIMEKNTLGGGVSATGTYKGCLSQCQPRGFTLSTTTTRRVQASTACCYSENCNENLTLSVPAAGVSENGVNCPVCENKNEILCAGKNYITCMGVENKCITLSGIATDDPTQNFSLRGCATQTACDLTEDDLVPYAGKVYKLTGKPVCTNAGILGAFSSPATFFTAMVGIFLVNVLS